MAPLPSVCTWNASSISPYPDKASLPRHLTVAANLQKAADSHDFVCIQETNFNALEGDSKQGVLGRMVRGCKAFYSNLKSKIAGVAILVKDALLVSHDIAIIDLPPTLKGHALGLWLTPRDPTSQPFSIFNIYLKSGDSAVRETQLRALMTVAPPVYSLFAGDWNFVVDPTDSSSSSCTNPTSSFLKTWFDFLAHFGLRAPHILSYL